MEEKLDNEEMLDKKKKKKMENSWKNSKLQTLYLMAPATFSFVDFNTILPLELVLLPARTFLGRYYMIKNLYPLAVSKVVQASLSQLHTMAFLGLPAGEPPPPYAWAQQLSLVLKGNSVACFFYSHL